MAIRVRGRNEAKKVAQRRIPYFARSNLLHPSHHWTTSASVCATPLTYLRTTAIGQEEAAKGEADNVFITAITLLVLPRAELGGSAATLKAYFLLQLPLLLLLFCKWYRRKWLRRNTLDLRLRCLRLRFFPI